MIHDSNLRAKDKIDVIGSFTAIFTGESVVLGGKSFPLGQISTDVLNMPRQYRELAVDWDVSRRVLTIVRDQRPEAIEPILTPPLSDC